MFGFMKRANVEASIKKELEKIKFVLKAGGVSDVPLTVWMEPYVLGYLFTSVTSLLQEANGSAHREEKAGYQVLRCLEHLTGWPTPTLAARIANLHDAKDPQFERGSESGMFWALLMKGKANRDHPAVAELLTEASNSPFHRDENYTNALAGAAGLAMMRDLIMPMRTMSQASHS